MAVNGAFNNFGNVLEDAQRKAWKAYLDGAHKIEKAQFDLQFPEPPKEKPLSKNQGNTAVLGTLLSGLVGGGQGAQAFGQNYLGGINQSNQQEAQRQALVQQMMFERQQKQLELAAKQQRELGGIAYDELQQVRGAKRDVAKQAYDKEQAALDRASRERGIQMGVTGRENVAGINARKEQFKAILPKLSPKARAELLEEHKYDKDLVEAASEWNADELLKKSQIDLNVKRGSVLDAQAQKLLQQVQESKLLTPLRAKELEIKIQFLPAELQMKAVALRALVAQRQASANLSNVKTAQGGFAPPKPSDNQMRLNINDYERGINKELDLIAPKIQGSIRDVPAQGSKELLPDGRNRRKVYEALIKEVANINAMRKQAIPGGTQKATSKVDDIKSRLGIKY